MAWLDAGGPSPVDGADADDGARRCLPRRSTSPWSGPESCATARTRTSGAPATGWPGGRSWWDEAVQHGGKELSYLNIFDADAAWRLVHELAADAGRPAVAIIKHANPCGAAVADDLVDRLRAGPRVRSAVGLRRDRGHRRAR